MFYLSGPTHRFINANISYLKHIEHIRIAFGLGLFHMANIGF